MAKTFVVAVSSSRIENFEDILENLGGFGRFQILILVLLLSLELPAALVIFSPIFIGAQPINWMCKDQMISMLDMCSCNETLTTTFSSIVAEWNLICDSAWVSDFITSLQMLGMFVGNLFGGQISDWYGRKYTFCGTATLMVLGTAASAVSPNAYVFAAARFICGAGFAGFISISGIYAMEFMPPRWRLICTSVGPLGEGIMLLGVLAYFVRSWRSLLWVSLAPFLLIVVIFPFVPESPRWLIRNQKLSEAQKVLNFIAKLNKTAEINADTVKTIAEKERVEGSTKIKKISYLQFFKDKDVRKTTLCLMILWSTWAIMYFGISYNIKNVGGNVYLNVVFMGLADGIGYPISFFVNSRMGRRKAVAGFNTFTAFFLVLLAILYLVFDLTHYSYVVVTLCLLGKFTAAGARSSMRTLTGESYPTSMRNMGMGIIGMSACATGIFAPQLAYLGSRWPSIPFFAFGIFSLCGALISFLLKETKGKPLQSEVTNNKAKEVVGPHNGVTRRVSINTIIST